MSNAEKQDLVERSQTEVQQHTGSEADAWLQVIERVSKDPQADVDKLERMMSMYERVQDREAKAQYDSALAEMQAELPEVERLAQGHNSMYAKFEHVLTAIKPHLKAHGFSITHRVEVKDSLIHITGVLSHRAGHREETTLALPPDDSGSKNPVQAVASSTEYGRRYTMNSLVGIATKDADKDGGAAQELTQKAADWIAAVDTCETLDALKKTYQEAFKDLEGDEYGRRELNAAKDAKKKALAGDSQ